MRRVVVVPAVGLVVVLALLLAGCGDSHPLPASGATPQSSAAPAAPAVASAQAATSSASAHEPATGSFAVAAANALTESSEPSGKCNLDAIDGAPVGSKPLARTGRALFAGWAGANDGAAVPAVVTIVLHGTQDFTLQTPTGAPRPDVATANGMPALADSGYVVKAGLGAVAAGNYKVELRFRAGGKTWHCETAHSVTVE